MNDLSYEAQQFLKYNICDTEHNVHNALLQEYWSLNNELMKFYGVNSISELAYEISNDTTN